MFKSWQCYLLQFQGKKDHNHVDVIIIYNYFTGNLREFYFTKGSKTNFVSKTSRAQWDLQYSDRKNSEICSTLTEKSVRFAVLWPKKQWDMQYSDRRNSEIFSTLKGFAVLRPKKQWDLQYSDRKKQWDLQYSDRRNSEIYSTLIE